MIADFCSTRKRRCSFILILVFLCCCVLMLRGSKFMPLGVCESYLALTENLPDELKRTHDGSETQLATAIDKNQFTQQYQPPKKLERNGDRFGTQRFPDTGQTQLQVPPNELNRNNDKSAPVSPAIDQINSTQQHQHLDEFHRSDDGSVTQLYPGIGQTLSSQEQDPPKETNRFGNMSEAPQSTAVDRTDSAQQHQPPGELSNNDHGSGRKLSPNQTPRSGQQQDSPDASSRNDDDLGTKLPQSHDQTLVAEQQPPDESNRDDDKSEKSLYPPTCAQKSRVSLYKKVCDKYNVHNETNNQFFFSAAYDKKLLGCLILKAGSSTWFRYLYEIYDPTNTNARNLIERDPEYLQSIGLDRIAYIPIANISKQYHDWHKYIVVRHPLQRIVSGYFDAAIRRKDCANPDGTPLSFLQFVQKKVSGELCRNPHWMMYTPRCKMCDVDYQFIVKQETIDEDIETFKELYGLTTNISLKVRNANERTFNSTDTRFKYDAMLGRFQQEHPELMRKFLDLLSYDMELFGYGWDWEKRKSYCVDDTASGCC